VGPFKTATEELVLDFTCCGAVIPAPAARRCGRVRWPGKRLAVSRVPTAGVMTREYSLAGG